MIFTHGGATGDIIFSLPTIKAMGGGDLIIHSYSKQRFDSIKPLLEIQDYIGEVTWSDNKPTNAIDLDKFREYAGHHQNLIEAHFKGQGLNPNHYNWRDGWLKLPESKKIIEGKYSVVNRTTRYNDQNFDWKKEIDYLKSISDKVYFIGYEDEYKAFNQSVEFYPCDFLIGAYLIKDAVMFTGNYSCFSTIAMGLGINYRLEQAPEHTCSSLLMPRETIINV